MTMHKSLQLREYKESDPVWLSISERDRLRIIAPSISIFPVSGETDVYRLKPGSKIGSIRIGGLVIHIMPKISIANVLFMISYAIDRIEWKEDETLFDRDLHLISIIALIFLRKLHQATCRGLLHGYRHEEDELLTVRGRIRIEDQIRRRFGASPPVAVAFDEFTDDILENRLLRAALKTLCRMQIGERSLEQQLYASIPRFEMVSDIAFDPQNVPEVSYSRLNEHYRDAIELARLILASQAYEHRGEERTVGRAFLIDMNKVFEDFLVVALRKSLGASDRSFPQGARDRKLYLDDNHRIRLEPDLSLWKGSRCLFVGDAKYKYIKNENAPNADIYQMLAYLTATELEEGLLVGQRHFGRVYLPKALAGKE